MKYSKCMLRGHKKYLKARCPELWLLCVKRTTYFCLCVLFHTTSKKYDCLAVASNIRPVGKN